jgi:hypothetical protein
MQLHKKRDFKMKKTTPNILFKNKSTIFFILITILYLILEVSFRFDMLNVTSTVKDFVEIESVEVTGRFLASLGFVIFILSNISFNNIFAKIVAYPLIGVLSFMGFYQGQSMLIDSIGSHFDYEEKTEMALLLTDKELIYFNELKYPNLFSLDESNESKILLSMYPFLRKNDDKHIRALKSIKKDLITANSNVKYSKNTEHLESLMKKEVKKLNDIYYFYSNVSNDTPNKKLFTTKDKHLIYKTVLHEYPSNFNLLGAYFPRTLNAFGGSNNGGISKTSMKMYSEKLKKYEKLSKSEFNQKIKNIEKTENIDNNFIKTVYHNLYSHLNFDSGKNSYMSNVTLFAHPLMQDAARMGVSSFMEDYNYSVEISSSNCKVLESDSFNISFNVDKNKYSFNKGMSTEKSEELFKNNYYKIFKNKYKKDIAATLNCSFDYSSYEKRYNKFYTKMFSNHPLFMTKIYPQKTSDLTPKLVNSRPLLKKIGMSLLHKEIYMRTNRNLYSYFKGKLKGKYEEFYNTVSFLDSKSFSRSINIFLMKVEKDYFYEKVKDYDLNFDSLKNKKVAYSPYDFYAIPEIKEQIKKKFPFMMNNGRVIVSSSKIEGYNESAFIKYLSKIESDRYTEALVNNELMKENRKYEVLGNNFAKGFVSIPLVLLISTFMIILSIINIFIKTIGIFEIKKKYLNISKSLLFIAVIFVPVFLGNSHSENNIVKENTFALKHSTNWLFNTQLLMDYIHIDNTATQEVYKVTKLISYMIAINYNEFNDKKSESLQMKLEHDKKKFNY